MPKETFGRILHACIKSKRCAEVVFEMLKAEGLAVSLSSVKRKLSRYGLLKKRSPWKRVRVYTTLDVHSRYGFAAPSKKASCGRSISFLKKAIAYFPFHIQNIQTDNGPEFGAYFTDFVTRSGMTHRHTHPRSPNENGHLERFNRTIQEEITRHGWCIFIEKDIRAFLKHYNHERLHMGINFKTPAQLVTN